MPYRLPSSSLHYHYPLSHAPLSIHFSWYVLHVLSQHTSSSPCRFLADEEEYIDFSSAAIDDDGRHSLLSLSLSLSLSRRGVCTKRSHERLLMCMKLYVSDDG